jgi:hypothetical protein
VKIAALLLTLFGLPTFAAIIEYPKALDSKPPAGVGAYFDKQTEIQGAL